MREILFRGKRIDNGEWVEGYYLKSPEFDGKGISVITQDKPRMPYYVNTETVGQYTGLTDKNGKRIFEGDIIKQIFCLKHTNGVSEREIRSVVEYGISWNYSDVCGVCQRFSDGSGIAMLSVMNTSGIVDCEVIGNIHDNPELLKDGE